MHEHVLLVEDDPAFLEIMILGLEHEGLRVVTESDGRRALDRFLSTPNLDLVLLDLMLPSLSGVALCREIRKRSQVPIMMLTARVESQDVILGLEAGADEYVRKPVELPELVARIRAVLRRGEAMREQSAFSVGGLEIDPRTMRVSREGREVPLTATEFRLLTELAGRPGQVFTREMLLERIWDSPHIGDYRLVTMAIKRLRDKVEDDPGHPSVIETVRGMGYRMSPD